MRNFLEIIKEAAAIFLPAISDEKFAEWVCHKAHS
jgi:hypothetical protein